MQFTTSIDIIYALQIESVEIRLQIFPMFTVLYSENIILSAWLQSRANGIKLLSTAEGITENLHTETKKKNTKTSKTAKTSQWNTAAFLACILVFFCAFIRKFSQSGKMRPSLSSSTAVLTKWCSKACSYFSLAWLHCEAQPQPARELYTSVLSPHSLRHCRRCNKP